MNFDTIEYVEKRIAEVEPYYSAKFKERTNDMIQLAKKYEMLLPMSRENITMSKENILIQGFLVDLYRLMDGKLNEMDYRTEYNVFKEFDKECIGPPIKDTKVTVSILKDYFKNWYTSNYGNGKNPPYKQMLDYMGKKYGRGGGDWSWTNFSILFDKFD